MILSVSIPSQPLSPWVLFDVACALSQGFSCWAESNFWLVSGASGKQGVGGLGGSEARPLSDLMT